MVERKAGFRKGGARCFPAHDQAQLRQGFSLCNGVQPQVIGQCFKAAIQGHHRTAEPAVNGLKQLMDGIGFVVVVDAASAGAVSAELDRMQLAPRTIGTVIEHADAATERVRIG